LYIAFSSEAVGSRVRTKVGFALLRELARGPAIGITDAAFHAATLVATAFSVVTALTCTFGIANYLVPQ